MSFNRFYDKNKVYFLRVYEEIFWKCAFRQFVELEKGGGVMAGSVVYSCSRYNAIDNEEFRNNCFKNNRHLEFKAQ